jgi:hypothetical protein
MLEPETWVYLNSNVACCRVAGRVNLTVEAFLRKFVALVLAQADFK